MGISPVFSSNPVRLLYWEGLFSFGSTEVLGCDSFFHKNFLTCDFVLFNSHQVGGMMS